MPNPEVDFVRVQRLSASLPFIIGACMQAGLAPIRGGGVCFFCMNKQLLIISIIAFLWDSREGPFFDFFRALGPRSAGKRTSLARRRRFFFNPNY